MKRVLKLEDEEEGGEEPVSIIERTLDILNIRLLIKIGLNKIHIISTNSFIDGLIMLIFLIILYNSVHILALNFEWQMLILYIIVIFVLLDFLGSNSNRVKGLLYTDEKNRIFLEQLKNYSASYVESQSIVRKFSPNNINFFLNQIKADPANNYGYVFENILGLNQLSQDNLNLIFTPEILSFFRKRFLINLLVDYSNFLSKLNVTNVYDYYKTDSDIIKILFATQRESEFLLRSDKNNPQLKVFQDHFRTNPTKEFNRLYNNFQSAFKPTRKLLTGLLMLNFPPAYLAAFFVSTKSGYTTASEFFSVTAQQPPWLSVLIISFPISFVFAIIFAYHFDTYYFKSTRKFVDYVMKFDV